jgi:predicted Zn-ribbon and HTH transcriptional regulator
MPETLRQRIREFISQGPKTVREISQEVRLSEKEVLDHLRHISAAGGAKGAGGAGGAKGASGAKGHGRFEIIPSECYSCGFSFAKRKRPGRPGRCPVCKSERISEPRYLINAPEEGRDEPA